MSNNLDPSVIAALKLVLPADLFAAVIAILSSGSTPAPAPVVVPPPVRPVRPFTASGRELADKDRVEMPETRTPSKILLAGPAGFRIGYKMWFNGNKFFTGYDLGKPSIVDLAPYHFDSDGSCTINGCVLGGGPSIYEKEGTVKTEFWAAPFGTSDWVLVGSYEVTIVWEPGLKISRPMYNLTFDPYRFPILCSEKWCPAQWTAEDLGIPQREFDKIRFAIDNGLATPPNPAGWAPGSPVA